MKDAKGHGSDPRAGQKLAAAYRAAHQIGIDKAVPGKGSDAARYAKLALKLYVAQAAAGAAIGGSIPWLKLAGILP